MNKNDAFHLSIYGLRFKRVVNALTLFILVCVSQGKM